MAHMIYGGVTVSILTFNFAILPISALFGEPDFESGIVYGWTEITETATTLMENQSADFC